MIGRPDAQDGAALDEQELQAVADDTGVSSTDQPEREATAEGERSGRRRRRGRGRRRGGERNESGATDTDAEQIELLDDEAGTDDAEASDEDTAPVAFQTDSDAGADEEPVIEAAEEPAREAPAAQAAPEAPRPAPAKPVKAAVVVPAPAPVQRERVIGRVSNDPRINPRPVTELDIVTESIVIDPSSFPPVALPVSTRPRPPRAANDPRIGRVAAAGDNSEEIAESA